MEQQNLRGVYALSKIVARFQKLGDLKFISHLDIMRMFERAFRRASIEIKHTHGYNKHPVMSFASPLGVGLTSEDEYIEVELENEMPVEEFIERLNKVLPNEVSLLAAKNVDEKSKPLMGVMAAAEYNIKVDLISPCDFKGMFENVINMDTINIDKKTKSGIANVDIKPMIYEVKCEKLSDLEYKIKLLCATGSRANLSADLFVKAITKAIGENCVIDDYSVHRTRLFIGEKENLIRPI